MEKDIFCKIIDGELESDTFYEDQYVKCIMDINPFTPGHVLIIPKKHYTTILDMDNDTLLHIHEIATRLIKKMETTFPYFRAARVLVNYGEEQKVKHYHMHILPLYSSKDTLSQKEYCELLKK